MAHQIKIVMRPKKRRCLDGYQNALYYLVNLKIFSILAMRSSFLSAKVLTDKQLDFHTDLFSVDEFDELGQKSQRLY